MTRYIFNKDAANDLAACSACGEIVCILNDKCEEPTHMSYMTAEAHTEVCGHSQYEPDFVDVDDVPNNSEPSKLPAAVTVPTAFCHLGNILVLEKDGVRVFGGGTIRDVDLRADVFLDLADHLVVFQAPQGWRINEWQGTTIKLYIQDYSAPYFSKEFWSALWLDLRDAATAKGKAGLDVLVFCSGGHGRTGLVLCALALASGIVSGVDVVKWVRDNYCNQAVESEVQIKYLADTFGVKIDAKPRGFSYGGADVKWPI